MSLYKLQIWISELSNQWCSFYAAVNSRTCIIIFYQYSLHWNWRTCQQPCYRRFTNLWWTSLWYNEVRKDTYCISFQCIYALWTYTHMKIHRPILLLCLSDVVIDQWRKMKEQFSELTIVLEYDDKSESLIASKLNWIDVSTFKRTSQNFTEWSSAISYMWDITDSQAFKVVLLTSYDMWIAHTVKMRKKTQLISEGFKEIQILYSDWFKMIALIVINEGHHLRNLKIKAHVSVWDLNCDHHWFLTATSSINTLLIS